MANDIVDILGKSKLFSGFSVEQLDQVMTHMQPKLVTFKHNDLVYKRGEPADRCWLIQSGNLTVKRMGLRTKFRKMIYNKGSVTGIQGLADFGSKRAVTMIAEDKVKLIEITYDGISKLDNETQIQLWKNVSRLLLRKLSICLSAESFDD